MSANRSDAKAMLTVGDRSDEIFRLDALRVPYDVARLPVSLKIPLENLLRNEDGEAIDAKDLEALRSGMETESERRDRVHARARGDAGLHQRTRRR
jgi:aconitate hydratase